MVGLTADREVLAVPPAISPSDAPQRQPGTRTRSGNAMLRTRAAILDAAARCIERYGVRKTTMSDVATQAGVAKATLYNHFRTKDDVLAALVTTRVAALAATCAAIAGGRRETPVPGLPAPTDTGLAAALEHAAAELAASGPLRRIAAEEPAFLAVVAVPGTGRTWETVRSAVGEILAAVEVAGQPAAADLTLRWLVGQAVWPGTPAEVALGARLLERGLRATAAASATPVDGLGWPG